MGQHGHDTELMLLTRLLGDVLTDDLWAQKTRASWKAADTKPRGQCDNKDLSHPLSHSLKSKAVHGTEWLLLNMTASLSTVAPATVLLCDGLL